MPNPFVHVELSTSDLAKAKSFYGSLFNWKLEDTDMVGICTYTTIGVDGGTAGGMMKHPMPGQPSFWLAYVSVDDLVASIAKAKSLGATILRDVTPVAEMGWLGVILDTTGAPLGLWQAKAA
jgi:predicted enzyme related to lactoylglutathione lyase